MKRIIFLGPLVTLLIAAGVWFGLPVYAEDQFRKALDAHVAARNDSRVGYVGAELDYWNRRATIAQFTDLVALPDTGLESALLLTVQNVVIEGYDLEALNNAARPADGAIQTYADLISWSGFSGITDSGQMTIQGGPGTATGLAVDGIDPKAAGRQAGQEIDSLAQGKLTVSFARDQNAVQAELLTLTGEQITENGFAALTAGPFKLKGQFPPGEDGGKEMQVTAGWAGLSMQNLKRGEPTTLAQYSQQKATLAIDLGRDVSISQPTGTRPLRSFEFSMDSYDASDVRMDDYWIDFYRQVDRTISSPAANNRQAIAALMESGLVMLERMEALKVGAALARFENLRLNAGGVTNVEAESWTLEGMAGLKVARMETINQTQTDHLGNAVRLERATQSDVDFSGLPVYLRCITGTSVTVESEAYTRKFFREQPITALIPVLDYGQGEVTGYSIATAPGPDIKIARIGWDALKSDSDGNIRMSTSFEGLKMDLQQIASADQENIQFLSALGMESIDASLAYDVTLKTAGGIVEIDEISLAEASLVDMKLTGKLAGLDLEKIRHMTDAERQGALMSLIVDDVTFDITDLGGRKLGFGLMAGQSGASDEQMAQALSAQAQQIAAGLGTAAAVSLGEAVASFLREGGSLSLSAENGPPVPIIQLMLVNQQQGPGALIDLLQIEAEHRAPN